MTNSVAFPSPDRAKKNEKLGAEITLLSGQLNAGSYRLLHLIAEFDDGKGWSGAGTVRSCVDWLNWKCGIGIGAAREKVRVAHCLAELPLIDAAFATGEISYSKVRAMTRVATPENEDYLLMIAQHGTASHMEQVVAKYRKVQRTCADSAEREQRDARKLLYYQDDDGMWVIHARLPAVEGALVAKAIDAVVEPIQAEKRRQVLEDKALNSEQEVSEESGPEVEEKISAEIFTDEVDDVDDCPRPDSRCQTQADALVAIAEHFVASSDNNTPVMGLKGSERCQVMLHIDINTLRQQDDPEYNGQQHCHLDDNNWIAARTARRLACDASLVTVLEDEAGNVLNIGRRARTVPAAIRRALSLRDKTCRFPGCTESHHVESHHVEHWADGGETSLDNLATLCRTHHAQLHRGCFEIRLEESSSIGHNPQLIFVTPSGKIIERDLFPQFPPQVAENAAEALRCAAPEITTTTCVTRWQGESCDYSMAIDGLLQRDGNLQFCGEMDHPPTDSI